MFRKLTVLLSLILTMAVTSSAVAQTPSADNPVDTLNEIASEVSLYGRSYEADMSGTPSASDEMPILAIIQAYEFADAETAAEAFPYVEQLMKDELEPIIGSELESEDVEDLGDTATLSTAELEQSGMTISLALLMVQQDEVIYLSATGTMNGPADELSNEFMTFMLDGEPGDADDVEFMEDGASTGGYFDVFPTEEDTDIVQGLQVTEDMYEAVD